MQNLPLIVQNRLLDFSDSEKIAYYELYNDNKKSVFIAYLFLIPLGWHYAYLKKWGLQVLCILTAWGFLIWWLIDWFRVPTLVRNYNNNLSIEILSNFVWVSKKEEISANKSKIEDWIKKNPNMSLNDYYRLNNK